MARAHKKHSHSEAKAKQKNGRHRARQRHVQQYAWLGAGAVTLGVGAALASGSGIAHADTTTGATKSSDTRANHASPEGASSSSSTAPQAGTGDAAPDSSAMTSVAATSPGSSTRIEDKSSRTAQIGIVSSSGGNVSAPITSAQRSPRSVRSQSLVGEESQTAASTATTRSDTALPAAGAIKGDSRSAAAAVASAEPPAALAAPVGSLVLSHVLVGSDEPTPAASQQVSVLAAVVPSDPPGLGSVEPLAPRQSATPVRAENMSTDGDGSATSSSPTLIRGVGGTTTTMTAESSAAPGAAGTAQAPGAGSAAATSDPAFSMTSWLNGTSIQPGSSVQLALQELSDAQSLLAQQTWGQGNILAGIVSVMPQALLMQAQWSLSTWQSSNPAAQASVANTVGIPIVHDLAVFALVANAWLPSVAQASMSSAALFIPAVGVFGPSGAASEALQLVSQAGQNGRVYAVIPLQMKAVTEPVVYISVNGGPSVPVLVDTGSAGLVIGAQYVGQQGLGPSTGSGISGFSGGLTYSYDTYAATVDFGSGVITPPTSIDVVTPASQDAFASYFAPAGVVGVLGIGPNSAGPGPSIPTAALPGELKDGVLLYEPGGLLVLGPNPLPVRTSVPGAPDANLLVQIGNGSLVPVWAIIDSGGVLGTMPSYVIGNSQLFGNLPAGTLISVYAGDGQTLLYSYTTDGFNTPSVTSGTDLNTGYTPFQQGPVYVGFSGASGIGTTSFDYV